MSRKTILVIFEKKKKNLNGEVAEVVKALSWKGSGCQSPAGSNPVLTAIYAVVVYRMHAGGVR